MKERLNELLMRIEEEPICGRRTSNEYEFLEKCRQLRRESEDMYKLYMNKYYQLLMNKYEP